MNLERRCQILVEYAKWTALSAVKQGPIRAKEPVYRLLDEVAFSKMLNPSLGPISCNEFNEWHRCQTNDLCAQAKPYLPSKWVETHPGREFPVGWGTKLINVFLKTTAYVGDLGREGLRDALHPPLDNRLRDRLVKCFPEIRDVNFRSITAIATYEEYQRIIEGCRAAAEELAKRGGACSLFEVEQLWSTGAPPGPCRCS